MKKSFSLFELIIAISIISIILSQIKFSNNDTNFKEGIDRLKLYLNFTRYIAHIDNKKDIEDDEYQKKFWTLKFQKCSNDLDGLYFVIYSDISGGTAHFKKEETLKDPLTNKYLYSNYNCDVKYDESKYILLTKEYGINKVNISCNTTSTIGQISFDYEGNIYSSLGNNIKRIDQKCFIELFDNKNRSEKINIEPNTGYIY